MSLINHLSYIASKMCTLTEKKKKTKAEVDVLHLEDTVCHDPDRTEDVFLKSLNVLFNVISVLYTNRDIQNNSSSWQKIINQHAIYTVFKETIKI